MKINSARAGCNRPRPSETLRQRWGLTEWGDMQRGCVHVVLVVLWALGTVLECYCGSSWVVRSGGCCVDFRGIDAKKKQSSGGDCQEYAGIPYRICCD
ncbi:hypothetical protein XFEB_00215 [Xylella fastidiosa EB92.1]|nr:hypothetical protein XFEB_00215 [Xylella fastidiosa EB92.1]